VQTPRIIVVLPAPRSPSKATTAPELNSEASARPRATVSAALSVLDGN